MRLESREKWAVAAALAAVVLLGWVWLAPGWTTKKASAVAVQRQAVNAALLKGRWREAVNQDAGAPDAGEKFAAALTTELQDPDHVLTAEQRKLLIETVTRSLKARSAASTEEYLALTESEPGVRWIGKDDGKEWARIDGWFQFRFKETPDHADPRAILLRMIEASPAKDRIVGFGLGKRGLVSAVFRVRSSDQVDGRFWDFVKSMKKEEAEYWLRGPLVSAMRFLVPVRRVEQVIEEENSALVAGSMVAVATKGGTTFSWFCIWYWDGQSKSWQCDRMLRKGEPGLLY